MQKLVKVDDRGRVRIPQEFIEGLGGSVIIKKTREGLLLLPGKEDEENTDFFSEFVKVIESEPRRTGKPRNPSPAKMKAIWKEWR